MYTTKKMGSCNGFRAADQDMGMAYRHSPSGSCKDCVYFTSRNCGMDVADSIEPALDMLF